jgi:ArsR family transcriptional regulator
MSHTIVETDPMEEAAHEAADVMKALSNPVRLRLLCALVPQARTVSELMAMLGQSQSYVSVQLHRMRGEGIVACERHGREMHYSLSDPRVRPVLECLYAVFCPEE